MSGIARQSKLSESYPQADSPLVVSHGAWAGLALLLSAGSATVTVEADVVANGDFENEVEMLGVGTKMRYPSSDGANLLYNAGFIKITWTSGTLRILQKG